MKNTDFALSYREESRTSHDCVQRWM